MKKKWCSMCKTELLLNSENFSIQTKTASGFSTECRNCLRERYKDYRKANKEKIRIKTNEYRKNNPEWTSRIKKNDYKKHKESRLATVKNYRKNNPDKCNKLTKEKYAIKNAIRRAREQNADGSYTSEDIQRIYSQQKGRCLYCLNKVSNKYHIDHIVPLSRGGTNSPDNICISCQSCNLSKGSKLLVEWKPEFIAGISVFLDSNVH